ncbi:MAG: S8 family serine peptidase [Thermoleophilaceae bacterium]|nr:S8 family serine peptidase [Thermoleophilaceae bacterium]
MNSRHATVAGALAVTAAAAAVLVNPFAPTATGPAPSEPVQAAPQAPAAEPATDVIVRFRASADAGERAEARAGADTAFEESLPVPGLQLVDPKPGVSVRAAVAGLERSPDVLYAEPDASRRALGIPNDPLFSYEWGLHNTGQTVGGTASAPDADVDAPEAWELTTGSPEVAVAVVDSGVDLGHPDLSPNRWRNPGESGGGREFNGADDDANGLVDDVSGWDFADADNDPNDANGHGTHVAGTIGARGADGEGVAGVAYNTRLVALRMLGSDGSGSVSDAIRAYAYADQKGIRILNASLGGPSGSRAERDAIAAASNTLFVVAAGNDGADNDAVATYPCNHELANVVCVAATDQSDALAGFSNYGARNVDLAAPGVNIASTWLAGGWVLLDGTSMAAPHVAGAAALIWSSRPGASVADVRAALLGSVDPVPSLAGRTVSGGRLNALRGITSGQTGTVAAPGATAESDAPAATPAPSTAPAPSTTPGSTAPPPPPAPTVTSKSYRPALFRVRAGRAVRTRASHSRLFANDGKRVEVAAARSGRRYTAEGYAEVRMTTTQRAELRALSVSYDGNLSSRRAVLRLRLYDWRQRRWTTVSTRSATRTSDTSMRVPVERSPRDFVSSSGLVRVGVRGTGPVPFRTRTDLIRLTAGT